MRFALVLLAAALPAAAAPLPTLNIDAKETTVSGVSSGGYMAVQLHVAHSAIFGRGVAAVAGGPYRCAEGQVLNALTRCLGNGAIPVDALIAATKKAEADKEIDPLSHLAASRAFIFSGSADGVVKEATSTALAAYYAAFLPPAHVVHRKDVAAGHGFVTDEGEFACDAKGAPFILNCKYDLAGAALAHLYGKLEPRAAKASGALVEFDQAPFGTGSGLGEKGFAYIPADCAAGKACRLHVALHGCRQNAGDVGDAFARHAGYNRWAESNRIVVLYPQTGKGATNSCWDWWGYSDAGYAARNAPQMKAIAAMATQFSKR